MKQFWIGFEKQASKSVDSFVHRMRRIIERASKSGVSHPSVERFRTVLSSHLNKTVPAPRYAGVMGGKSMPPWAVKQQAVRTAKHLHKAMRKVRKP